MNHDRSGLLRFFNESSPASEPGPSLISPSRKTATLNNLMSEVRT